MIYSGFIEPRSEADMSVKDWGKSTEDHFGCVHFRDHWWFCGRFIESLNLGRPDHVPLEELDRASRVASFVQRGSSHLAIVVQKLNSTSPVQEQGSVVSTAEPITTLNKPPVVSGTLTPFSVLPVYLVWCLCSQSIYSACLCIAYMDLGCLLNDLMRLLRACLLLEHVLGSRVFS